MLVITMPVVFAEGETVKDFTFFGFIFAAAIVVIGVGNLILHHRVKTGKVTFVDYVNSPADNQQ
jgi:hypothetical protein